MGLSTTKMPARGTRASWRRITSGCRHEAAAKRMDIAGTGASDGVNRTPMSARDVNYKRLSDSDILNL
jgi:hypothetical protein